MCGIVGYIGTREAYPMLIEGLKRLEYRGYDSAGVALMKMVCPIRFSNSANFKGRLSKAAGKRKP